MALAGFALVQPLITDLITPIITAIVGEPDFSGLSFTINDSEFLYGDFINAIIIFVSTAAAVYFFVVKHAERVPALPLLDSGFREPVCALPPDGLSRLAARSQAPLPLAEEPLFHADATSCSGSDRLRRRLASRQSFYR